MHKVEEHLDGGVIRPVTMAVRPVPSIPCVTSSAVEYPENPDGPFPQNNHILSLSFFTPYPVAPEPVVQENSVYYEL